jgi:hypothetical protein
VPLLCEQCSLAQHFVAAVFFIRRASSNAITPLNSGPSQSVNCLNRSRSPPKSAQPEPVTACPPTSLFKIRPSPAISAIPATPPCPAPFPA